MKLAKADFEEMKSERELRSKLIIFIDRSGSMGGIKINTVKE